MSVSVTNGFLKQLQASWSVQVAPKQILILNLMPNRLETEKQFVSAFSAVGMDVNFTFMYADTHKFKGGSRTDIGHNYVSLAQIQDCEFDGLIITGAPVEKLNYDDVDYFTEFREILNWANTHVNQVLLECWAAQAGLKHYYDIEKYLLQEKLFGVFADEVSTSASLTMGIDKFIVPHSRHSNVQFDDQLDLDVLTNDELAGPVLLQDEKKRVTYMQGHPEYFAETLWNEFQRDIQVGKEIVAPQNYLKTDANWFETTHKFYKNWLDLI